MSTKTTLTTNSKPKFNCADSWRQLNRVSSYLCVGNETVRSIVIIGKKNDSKYSWEIKILTELELILESYAQPIQTFTNYQAQKKNTQASRENLLKNPN